MYKYMKFNFKLWKGDFLKKKWYKKHVLSYKHDNN